MPPQKPQMLAHVVYRTRRHAEMLDWYQTVFGATVQHQDSALTFLTYDNEHHRVALLNLDVLVPEVKESENHGLIGLDHVAYTFTSLDDLFDHYIYLRDKGITPYWCVHHGLTVSMYYADPDGNQTELNAISLSIGCRGPHGQWQEKTDFIF